MDPISIYAYDDFRLFIKDRYALQKRSDPACSARTFAKAAGFTNPGYLNDVIKGRRSLSQDARLKLCAAFRLSESEAEYFDILVRYGQSKKDRDRQEFYRKLLSRRNRSAFTKLHPALSKYYQDFRYPLVYNALMTMDFRGDFEGLSRFLYPAIPSAQVKSAVTDLCEWGLVILQESGRYTVTQRFVEPPETLREHMRLPADKRHMSTMLVSVTAKTASTIAKKVEQFRQEIWELVQQDQEQPSCIMQLNVQYFPRSKAKPDASQAGSV
jgi:uncharacterized protein (TIGR02147 family)